MAPTTTSDGVRPPPLATVLVVTLAAALRIPVVTAPSKSIAAILLIMRILSNGPRRLHRRPRRKGRHSPPPWGRIMWLAVCIAASLMHSEATDHVPRSRTMTLQEEEALGYPSMEGK